MRKQSKNSLPKLKRKAWKLFAAYVKERDGAKCFSCGRLADHIQAGHFLKAEVCNLKYRYDERNVHSQCTTCNLTLKGAYPEYRRAMLKVYGEEVVNELEEHYREPLELGFDVRSYLEGLIEKYKLVSRGK